jgi:hypothetical protein
VDAEGAGDLAVSYGTDFQQGDVRSNLLVDKKSFATSCW